MDRTAPGGRREAALTALRSTTWFARMKRSRAILGSDGFRSAALTIVAVLLILVALPIVLVAAGS